MSGGQSSSIWADNRIGSIFKPKTATIKGGDNET